MSVAQNIQGSVGARRAPATLPAQPAAQPAAPTVSLQAVPRVNSPNPKPIATPPPPRLIVRPVAPTPQAPAAAANAPAGSEPIAAYIELEAEARASANLEALRFLIVNATRKLAKYDQAFLLEPSSNGAWRVRLASSTDRIDRNSTRIRALEAWVAGSIRDKTIKPGEAGPADAAAIAGTDGGEATGPALTFGLWQPIRSPSGETIAALLALKHEAWRAQQLTLLSPLAGAYGHAWAALRPKHGKPLSVLWRQVTGSRLLLVALVAGLAGAVIKVPLTALAPAEIAAAAPAMITAPMDGVVGDILVAPGARVEAGSALLRLVDTKPRNDVAVATKAKSVAEARYFKALQSALSTQKDMEDLSVAKGELQVAEAELASAQDQLSRTVLKAPSSGLAIYSSKSDWIGKPVGTGERIMEIGDPSRVELRIDLPVSDAIALKPGDAVTLFPDGDPLRTVGATISRTNYRPVLSPDQQLVFKVYAGLQGGDALRIGLHGTARLSGESVSLWFYLLRRPLSMLRQRIGY